MSELGDAPQPVSEATMVIHRPRLAVPQGRNDVGVRLEAAVELGPDLADSTPEVRVRGAERRKVELRGEFAGAFGVRPEVFRVVHLDPVDPIAVGTEVVRLEADGCELRMRREDGRTLAIEFGQRRLQRDEIRHRIGEPDRQDVFSVPPIPREHLTARNDQQILVGEPLCTRSDVGKAGEMWRVDEAVKPPRFRPFDHAPIENFHVRIQAKPVHIGVTARPGVIRCDSSRRVLYTDDDDPRMWECAIGGCGYATEDAEELLVHQATGHERHRCAVCGTTVPDGYFAIRHAFSEHSRAEYLRNYEAETDDIRLREAAMKEVEAVADVEAVVGRLDGEREAASEA